MAAATIRRLHPDALVDSMGTANPGYGETTNVAKVTLNPDLPLPAAGDGQAPLCPASASFRSAAAIQLLRGSTQILS